VPAAPCFFGSPRYSHVTGAPTRTNARTGREMVLLRRGGNGNLVFGELMCNPVPGLIRTYVPYMLCM
jgi:hypothetical protein